MVWDKIFINISNVWIYQQNSDLRKYLSRRRTCQPKRIIVTWDKLSIKKSVWIYKQNTYLRQVVHQVEEHVNLKKEYWPETNCWSNRTSESTNKILARDKMFTNMAAVKRNRKNECVPFIKSCRSEKYSKHK